MKNYYKIFDIPQDADSKTIRKAYLKKVKKSHPDTKGQYKEKGTEALNELKYGYEILKDPVERYFYDLRLEKKEKTTSTTFHDSVAAYSKDRLFDESDYSNLKYKGVLIFLWVIIGFLLSLTISVYISYKNGDFTSGMKEEKGPSAPKKPNSPKEPLQNDDKYIKEI